MNSGFDQIVSCCQELLETFPPASKVKEYIDNRLPEETQRRFQFGYFPTNEHLHILEETVGEAILFKENTNLIYDMIVDGHKTRHGILENNNLIMPYKDLYGKIVGLVGRSIQSDDERTLSNVAKYKNTSFDKGKNLFGLYSAKKYIVDKNKAIILEGQFDCIAAQEKGILNAVALGSSNMTFDQLMLVMRYTNNIVLLLDNDEAGKIGAQKIKAHYDRFANIQIASLPCGYKDLDDMKELGEFIDII